MEENVVRTLFSLRRQAETLYVLNLILLILPNVLVFQGVNDIKYQMLYVDTVHFVTLFT